jgi:hypothetical protein
VLPSRGKYGLVQIGGEDDDTEVLVGPEFLAESRLSDKGIESAAEMDDDFDSDDKVENEESNAQEGDSSKRPSVVSEKEKEEANELDGNKQVEPVENFQFPYGINFNKLPQFPPTFENALGYPYQNPYFLPPNSYAPIPIVNQYLQRRAALRYPPLIPLYPSLYGQNSAAQLPYAQPYRVFYAPQ